MKNSKKIISILYGVAFIVLPNLIRQDDWAFTLFTALIFVIGAFAIPPLITFMSNNKKDNYYK